MSSESHYYETSNSPYSSPKKISPKKRRPEDKKSDDAGDEFSPEYFDQLMPPSMGISNQNITQQKHDFKNGGWRQILEAWNPTLTYPAIKAERRHNTAKKLKTASPEHTEITIKNYSADNLSPLVKIMAEQTEEIANRARFVLKGVTESSSGYLLFGQEGRPNGKTIPSHGELGERGMVWAAGTVVFNDAGKIEHIDNKSGDYQPQFASLRLVLLILMEKNLLANDIILHNERDNTSVKVTLKELAQLRPVQFEKLASSSSESESESASSSSSGYTKSVTSPKFTPTKTSRLRGPHSPGFFIDPPHTPTKGTNLFSNNSMSFSSR